MGILSASAEARYVPSLGVHEKAAVPLDEI